MYIYVSMFVQWNKLLTTEKYEKIKQQMYIKNKKKKFNDEKI